MRWLALTAMVIVLGAPAVARAHQTAVTHVEVSVQGDDAQVVVLTAPADVAEKPLDLPYDPPPTDDQLRAGAVAIAAHVSGGIALSSGDAPCTLEAPFAEPTHDDGDFVRVTWTARCPSPLERLVVEYDLFFDIDENHEAVLRVSARGEHVDTVLRRGESRFVWDLGEPPPSGTLAFIRSGIDHIVFGFDHIAFVLTLLVAIVLARGDGGWRRRRFREALKATAWIVTSFTIAHSITLIAASLGYVSIAAKIVESAIALSIAYTAVENIVKPDVPWRFVLTFVFGLIHGMGFARMLAVMLPPDDVVVPLLAFNVGVELGQLAIVAITLPLWWFLCGAVGPERYRRLVMPALSALLAVLGLLWLAERLFEITILGF
jgi:hypothetical protein